MLENMGQSSSCSRTPCMNYAKPKRKVAKLLSRNKNSKNILSHTFSLPIDNETYNHLNINLATEEELMTLSGINREIARGIVKHRQQIGRFRRIDDLALVAGIGAEKLDKLRGEVCVKSNSCSSSRAQSVDSLKSSDSRLPKLVNVNKASVFELQCINGINQEMAANIVHHRTKKGPYKKIDDLIKVRSINQPKLSNISHQLTVSDDESDYSFYATNSEVLNGINGINGNVETNGTIIPSPIKRIQSAPVKFHVSNGLPSASSLGDIYDLLSAYSHRPVPEEEFRYMRNGSDAFRIATWNLHEFTVEKAENLGVREVVCRTVLENRWSLVAFQDVVDESAMRLICDELNAPKLRKVAEFRTNSYDWQYTVVPHRKLAFLYDKHCGGIGIQLQDVENASNPCWALAHFSVGLRSFHVANVHLTTADAALNSNDLLNKLTAANNNNNNGAASERALIVGDFGNAQVTTELLAHFKAVLPPQTNTGLCNVRCSDNILVAANCDVLTGWSKQIMSGLTHLAIPNGWSWGGPVSPHCPLWAELYVNAAQPIQNGF